jgi:hypothetical protein
VGSWTTAIGVGMLLVAAVPRQAAAQILSPREVSGGYVYLNDSADQILFPAGWMAGGTLRLSNWLSVLGEGGLSTRTTTTFGSDIHMKVGTVLGGIRAEARLGRLTEFGQLAAGVVLASATGFGETDRNRAFGLQPGAGLDYPLSARLSARAQLDIRFIASGSNDTMPGREIRLLAGLVFKLR